MSLIIFNSIIFEVKAGKIKFCFISSSIFSFSDATLRIYILQFKGVRNSCETDARILSAYF